MFSQIYTMVDIPVGDNSDSEYVEKSPNSWKIRKAVQLDFMHMVGNYKINPKSKILFTLLYKYLLH